MSGFSTYTDLQASILSFMGRPGDANIPVTDIITMAEAEFNRLLQTQNQVTFSDITTVAGTQEYTLPSDFNAILEVKLTSVDPIVVLESMGPAEFDESWPFAMAGQPNNYTIVGNKISFGPIPDGIYTIRVRYYGDIPALSVGNPTNWLLTSHPDAYLWMALRHAETFLGADASVDRMQIFEQRAQAAVTAIKQQDIRFKSGGSPIRMRTYLQPDDNFLHR